MTVPIDRTKRVVEPFRLALATQRQGSVVYDAYAPRGMQGLHGMGQDTGNLWDDIVQAGANWLDQKIQASGISGTDPIAIQNAVGAAMDQISAQYYPLRDAHTVTVAQITQFQNAFRTLIDSFCNKMRQIGTTRALNGCTTIQYWGNRWIQDREAEKAAISSGTLVPTGCITKDPVTGQCIQFTNPPLVSGVTGMSTTTTLLLVGAAILLLAKNKIF